MAQFRTAVLLGALIAITPLSVDVYLPAFALIAADFGATETQVQYTLIAYMVALIGGPFLYGALSDQIGRRTPLMIGFVVYAVASVACATAPSIEALVASRFMQGLGGSAAMVCVQASVRDRYSGYEAARMLSMLMLVTGLAPILGPILGAAIVTHAPWRALFWILTAVGTASFAAVVLLLEETLDEERRSSGGVRRSIRDMRSVMSDRRFIPPALTGALGQAGFFVYLTVAPFLIMDYLGQPPEVFAFVFGTNAAGLVAGSQLNVWLLPKLGVVRVTRYALAVYATAATCLLLVSVLQSTALWIFSALLCCCITSQGFINANTRALAVEGQSDRAGSASALMMIGQTGLGAIAAMVVSIWGDFPAISMSAAMCLCGVLAFGVSSRLLNNRPDHGRK